MVSLVMLVLPFGYLKDQAHWMPVTWMVCCGGGPFRTESIRRVGRMNRNDTITSGTAVQRNSRGGVPGTWAGSGLSLRGKGDAAQSGKTPPWTRTATAMHKR